MNRRFLVVFVVCSVSFLFIGLVSAEVAMYSQTTEGGDGGTEAGSTYYGFDMANTTLNDGYF